MSRINVQTYTFLILALGTVSALIIGAGGLAVVANAQNAEEIRREIEERSRIIDQLEEEIAEHEASLRQVGQEKRTLENAVAELDLSRKKISTDISLTQQKINTTDYEIGELESNIAQKEDQIETNQRAISEAIRELNQVEDNTLVEMILREDSLSAIWDQVETLERFQSAVNRSIYTLNELKTELEGQKQENEEKKQEFSNYQRELNGKKQVLDQNRAQKNELLEVTENEEDNYQQLLAEKVAAREQFERELQNLEQQLQFTLDPSSIPTAGEGILGWPLNNLFVTQYFGNTPFAKSGGYAGNGHNGVDFRASVGTAVRSSLRGIVTGVGNTDAIPGCYSYGKWVLVKHNNGLSTLYAHLSVTSVAQGQSVETGDVIGLSGNTGYSTGPHLHYAVYLSEGVQVRDIGQWYRENGRSPTTACARGNAVIPVAPLEAYLNPLDYLSRADTLR